MKKKLFIQKLLAERTRNEEKFNDNGFPKNPNLATEDFYMLPIDENDATKDNFSSPIEAFDKVTHVNNNIEAVNQETSDNNVSPPKFNNEDWKNAVRKEYVLNNPTK